MPNIRHLPEVLIFFFHSKKTMAEAHRHLQKFYGDAALSETTVEDADVIYYDLLKTNETITGKRYRMQLMRLSRALREKRPQYEQRHEKLILQHDNAQPHVAKPVKTYLETLKWEVLPHSPYSPDIAPSNYYLFRSMAQGLLISYHLIRLLTQHYYIFGRRCGSLIHYRVYNYHTNRVMLFFITCY